MGSIVKIKDTLSNMTMLPNGYNAKWAEIEQDEITGFVFDAYLSKIPKVNFGSIDGKCCWTNDVLSDWATRIGKIDSID